MKIKIRLKKASKYDEVPGFYLFLGLFLNSSLIVDILRMLSLKIVPNLANSIDFIRNMIYAMSAAYVIFSVCYKGVKKKLISILGFILLVLATSLMAHPEIGQFLMDDIIVFLMRVLTGAFLFTYLTDYERAIRIQLRYLPLVWLYIILFISVGTNENYMGFSYCLIIPCVVYTIYGYEFKNPVYFITGVISLIPISFWGARGALATGIVAVALYFLFSSKLTMKKIIIIVVTSISAFGIASNLQSIAIYMLNKFGDSRTLSISASGELWTGGGRNTIQEIIVRGITILPHGLFADRIALSIALGVSVDKVSYPHNLFLEILYQYGAIFGSIIVIGLLFLLIRTWNQVIKNDNGYIKILFYAYVITFLFKSTISGSYLTDYTSGIALGICLGLRRNRKGIRNV